MLFRVLFCKRLVQSVLATLFRLQIVIAVISAMWLVPCAPISRIIVYLQQFRHADWLRLQLSPNRSRKLKLNFLYVIDKK